VQGAAVEARTLAELQEPDQRSLMWSVWTADPAKAAELAQRLLSQVALSPDVPETTRQSFERLCTLFSYGILCYDLYTVAGDLARLVVEQALRDRFLPFYGGTVNFTDGQGVPQAVTASSYDDLYRAIRRDDGRLRGWKLQPRSGAVPFVFSGELTSLLRWARAERLLAGQADRLRDQRRAWFRNFVAHPTYHLQGPDYAERGIIDLADLVNRIWGSPSRTAVAREPIMITWTGDTVTWGGSPGPLRDQSADAGPPTSVIALAVPGDPELGDYDALYETTSLPCEWLWGPGSPAEASDWLEHNPQAGDQAETVDRLFLLRYHDSLLWLPQKPSVAAAARGTAAEGTWYLLRADSPFVGFNHLRRVLSGYSDPEPGPPHSSDGDCQACPTQSVSSGSLHDMVARARRLGADTAPRPVPDSRVTMSRMPRCNRIGAGFWDIPPEA
jgi:hypothetical protein